MDSAAISLIVGGLIALLGGVYLFMRGTSHLTTTLRLGSPIVGGLVVLVCTGLPRLVLGFQSVWSDQTALGLGTLLGSNLFLLLFVLGLLAVVFPVTIRSNLIRQDVPVLIGAAVLVFLLGLDGTIGRIDGVMLLVALASYIAFSIRQSSARHAEDAPIQNPAPAPDQMSMQRLVLFTGTGFLLIVIGSLSLAWAISSSAQQMQTNALVIGLTLGAIATSLPEAITWIRAALRGRHDRIADNVIRTSLLNLLGILGLMGVIAPGGVLVPTGALAFDLPVLIAVSAASLPIFLTGMKLSRREGWLFAGYYITYLFFVTLTAPQHGTLPLLSMLLFAFVSAPAGLLVREDTHRLSGWVFALIPLTLFVLFCFQIPAIVAQQPISETYPWVQSMGVELAFTLNGLSLLFALIITGIGTLIVLYTSFYMTGKEGLGLFYVYLLIFMGSMLGVVLSANVLTLFVFWELTSASSYLLIGFKHEYPAARRGAQQGLLITAGGGLALLFGLLLLAEAAKIAGVDPAQAYNIDAILGAGDGIKQTSLYAPAVWLIFLGCFTKSAQFPFHFWLPNAMQAPTPASAFLHSATMVKAGIYLLARLNPGLGNTVLWNTTLIVVGSATLLVGATLAMRQYDLKALLAYSTISVLGILTLVIGLGGTYAAEAMVAYLLAHALYKSALFLVAGGIDHETGTRDLRHLGGLRKEMPISMILAILAGLSMAGIPITYGFVAKELVLKAAIESKMAMFGVAAALVIMVITAIFSIVYTWRFISGTFFGARGTGMHAHVHEAPVGMLIGPGIPASLTLLFSLGFLPVVGVFLSPAATMIAGEHAEVHLHIWEGWNLAFTLSVGIMLVGGIIAAFHRQIAAAASLLPVWLNSDRIYDATLDGLLNGAKRLTQIIQAGNLRTYLVTIIVAFLVLLWSQFLTQRFISVQLPPLNDLVLHEVVAALLIPVGVVAVTRAQEPIGAIISAGMVGAMVSLFFVLFSAPDLALTQLLIEVLLTVFLLLVFSVLPDRFEELSPNNTRIRDGFIAGGVGVLMTGLTLVAVSSTLFEPISSYYLDQSLPAGKGGNVVNVILVDFRGLDTLGEISVLFIAALGIYGLLRLRQPVQATAEHVTPVVHQSSVASDADVNIDNR